MVLFERLSDEEIAKRNDIFNKNIEVISNKARGIIGGITIDPKVAARPNETMLDYAGRRIRESATDAIAPVLQAGRDVGSGVKSFTSNLLGTVPTEKPTGPILPSTEEEAIRRNRFSTATRVARPEGTATFQPGTGQFNPLPEGFRTNQIRVGAATDAEAARNLQDRALQDQATQAEVARLDRATEAVKSLNEARAPAFRFGVDSIGKTSGIDSKLDEASGRVINRNTPASVVSDQMINAVTRARNFGGGTKAGLVAADQLGKVYLADKALQQNEIEAAGRGAAANAVSPLDMGKYLLDQQKFAQQQAVDKARLTVDQGTLAIKQADTAREDRKYAEARQSEFVKGFSYPNKYAPTDQIAKAVLKMSDATNGQAPPEAFIPYIEQALKNAGGDWEDAPPKNVEALMQEAFRLYTAANRK